MPKDKISVEKILEILDYKNWSKEELIQEIESLKRYCSSLQFTINSLLNFKKYKKIMEKINDFQNQ